MDMENIVQEVLGMFDGDQALCSKLQLTNHIVASAGVQDITLYTLLFKEISKELNIEWREFSSFYSISCVIENFYSIDKLNSKNFIKAANLEILTETIQSKNGCSPNLVSKYVDHIESVNNALNVRMFPQAALELKELLKIARDDMVSKTVVMDKILAAKMRIICTILVQSYDEEQQMFDQFFLLKDSIQKFIALEIQTCLKMAQDMVKHGETSTVFWVKSLVFKSNNEETHKLSINTILKQSCSYIVH